MENKNSICILTGFSTEEMEYSACITPAKFIPSLHKTFILGIWSEIFNHVVFSMVELKRTEMKTNTKFIYSILNYSIEQKYVITIFHILLPCSLRISWNDDIGPISSTMQKAISIVKLKWDKKNIFIHSKCQIIHRQYTT